MTTTVPQLNQVDLQKVGSLAEAIASDPTRAETRWSATVDWKAGFRSEASIRDFDLLASDEPFALGGTDSAPNPVEQLLAALGNCLAVGYAANLAAAGVAIESLRIEVEGDLDLHSFLGLRPGHAGFSGIRATVNLGTDPARRESVEEVHDKVVSTSPVGHTLASSIPVTITLNHKENS